MSLEKLPTVQEQQARANDKRSSFESMGGEVFGLSLGREGGGGGGTKGAALSTRAGGFLRRLWSRAMDTEI